MLTKMAPEKILKILASASKSNQNSEEITNAYSFAQEAVRKTIPRHLEYSGDKYNHDGVMGFDRAYCTICGHQFNDKTENWKADFCPGCGQALDWSDWNNLPHM